MSVVIFLVAAFHLYFFFFIQNQQAGYLLYLDLLLFVPLSVGAFLDYLRFHKAEEEKQKLLDGQELICRLPVNFDNKIIAEHDAELLTKQLGLRVQENQDLQDFIAKWCHELKLPLSALLLINERISDPNLRQTMREPLEKINQQLNTMLLGCRLQSPLLDLQIREVNLLECVKASIHNHQFFLIRHGFALVLEAEPLSVHTDPQWLVYTLDQLIHNAIKYGQKEGVSPVLKCWTEKQGEIVALYLEDYGQGIHPQDMGRIFEKGYTGQGCHNGKYKSTGMGLYMAHTIMERMGHELRAESVYGEYSRFSIIFRENPYYLKH